MIFLVPFLSQLLRIPSPPTFPLYSSFFGCLFFPSLNRLFLRGAVEGTRREVLVGSRFPFFFSIVVFGHLVYPSSVPVFAQASTAATWSETSCWRSVVRAYHLRLVRLHPPAPPHGCIFPQPPPLNPRARKREAFIEKSPARARFLHPLPSFGIRNLTPDRLMVPPSFLKLPG